MRKNLLTVAAFALASMVMASPMAIQTQDAAASAAVGTEFVLEGLTYQVVREGVVEVHSAAKDITECVIPASVTNEGVAYEVRTIGESAFKWRDVTNVTLPNTIDSIMHSAFDGSDLVSINLPESVKYLGEYAFDCDELTAINVPSGVEHITPNCFFSAKSLSEVTLNEGLKSIGQAAFYNCPKLTSIIIPESCDSLAPKVFLSCANLESVTLPANLRVMGYGMFRGCKKLTDVQIPSGITYLGDEMFLECESLTSFNIAAGIDSLGTAVFAKTGIASFTLDEANTAYSLVDGVVYSKDKRLLYAYPCKGDSVYAIENGCIGIMAGAFWGSDIVDVTLPEGMRAIDSYAFCESQLHTINFPESLIYMGEQALAGAQFTSIVLPENMPYVSDGLLAWNFNLTELTIPAGVVEVANHAFQTCKALTDVHLLGSVPPVISDYYGESDNPFGYISRSNVSLSVPAGFEAAYKTTDWGSLFSNIAGNEVAPLVYASINPATDTELIKLGAITMTFGVAVEVENNKPAIEVLKDDILVGSPVTTDAWVAVDNSSDHKSITFFMSDADGFASNVALESAVDYYVIIPKGIISDGAGNVNEMMRLHYVGGVFSGIEENTAASCQVAQNGLQLTVTPAQVADVTIYNASGAVVANQAAATQVVFTAPQAGLYIVKVGTTSFKVIVK